MITEDIPWRALQTAANMVIVTVYADVSLMTMVGSPVTHFLIAITVFVAFYLIRIIPDYVMAVGFCFTTLYYCCSRQMRSGELFTVSWAIKKIAN